VVATTGAAAGAAEVGGGGIFTGTAGGIFGDFDLAVFNFLGAFMGFGAGLCTIGALIGTGGMVW
jgi:hypothetical protein